MRESRHVMLAAIVAGIPMVSVAQSALDERVSFNIEPQPLVDALTQFSEQSGLYVVYLHRSPSVAYTTSNRVQGAYAVRDAIQRLLEGTPVVHEHVKDGTIRIVERKNISAAHSEPGIRLAQVTAPGARSTNAYPGEETSDRKRQHGDLEEVIVTAQRRAERLQDVPIAISVLSGENLDRSTSQGVTEALSGIPGVATSVYQQGGETQVTVRGVAAGLAQFNGSSPVGYYIDSVPFGLVKTAVAPDTSAYDLARVEVLRGPQGTLYGASALNGVVRIITNDANLERFELKGRTSLSSTEGGGENYRGDVAINVPLIAGKLAARAVAGYESLSGWLDRPVLGKKNANDSRLRNVRLNVGAQATDRLSIDLSAWLSRADHDQASLSRDGEQSLAPLDEPASTDYDVYGVTVGYDFSSFTFTGTSSYLDYQNDSTLNVAANPLFTGLSSEVIAHEVLLSSAQQGAWRWSIGGIYRDAEDRQLQTLSAFLLAPIDFTDRSRSFAASGELTRAFLDGRFEVTAGIRRFEDDVTQIENVSYEAQPDPLYRAERTFTANSPRVVVTWHPSDALTVYGSYAEGFRSGFNQDAEITSVAPEFPPVDADTLVNYELGAKGSAFNNRLTFDTAVYYVDWQDVQQSLAVPFVGTFVTAPINGESASGVGFEFGVASRPIEGLELGFTFSWNDLSMDTDVFSSGALLFSKGDRLNYSPEYTAGTSFDYSFALSGNSGYDGRFSASANFTSERAVRTAVNGVRTIWSGDDLVYANTSFSIESPDNWTATLFVDNANNEDGVFIRNIFGNPDRTVRTRPRTYGLQLEYRF